MALFHRGYPSYDLPSPPQLEALAMGNASLETAMAGQYSPRADWQPVGHAQNKKCPRSQMAARALALHGATTPCGTTGGHEPPAPLSCYLRFRIGLGLDAGLSLDVPLNRVHQRNMIELSR